MQPKCAVILIGEAGVRALGVKHLEQAVDVILAVLGPFVSVGRQKTDLAKQSSAVLRCWKLRNLLRANIARNTVEKTFHKSSKLTVSGGPVVTSMRVDRLSKVTQRSMKLKGLEELMDLVVTTRQVQRIRQGSAQGWILSVFIPRQNIAVSGEPACERGLGAKRGAVPR